MNRRLLTLTLLLSGLILTYFNVASAAPLADKLKGYILLQVQSHGEAWYVIPTETKRTYLADGPAAYNAMSKLGLGITNANLKKIPVGIDSRIVDIDSDGDGLGDKLEEGLKTNPNNIDSDGDTYSDYEEVVNDYNPLGKEKNIYDQTLINSLRGKILLQVEEKGQAWYVNPTNGHRYYMKDGPSAYEIMRFLSLGITNDNLNQIAVSSFSVGVPTPPTSTDTQAPTAPSNLVATATSTQITLTWLASSDNVAVSQYRIERSISATTGFTALVTVTGNSYINTGLSASTRYYYRIRAADAVGNLSSYSSVVNTTTGTSTPPTTTDIQAPTAPSSLVATATSTQITLTWSASTDNVAVSQYQIERSTSATTGFTSLIAVTSNSYINTGLNTSTRYYYRVRATDAAGNFSSYSSIANATTGTPVLGDTLAPSAPSNLVATSTSSTQINLTWSASTDNIAVSQYQIERATSSSFSTTHAINVVATSYSDTGLLAGTTYYYRVHATDAAGNLSGYSNIVNSTTQNNYTISSIVGEDYALPASVTASNFSGYVCSNCTNAGTTFIWTNWATIEPQNTSPRTYDWTYIDSQIAAAAAQGKKVSVMIHSTVAGGGSADANGYVEFSAVPNWVYSEFNLPPFDQLMNMGMTYQMHVIPSWRPEIRVRFEELIAAFGARYKNNNTIESIYITAVSHAQGEELWISNPQLTTIERDWGLTPQVLKTWLESRMSAWAQAFAGQEQKLVWVGSATGLSWNNRSDFELVARNLIDYAASLGIGGRAGLVECYLDRIGDYLWANFKDINGYIYVNESYPRFDGRYWGDENEEYGLNFISRYGADHSSPVRYRFAIMRSLQARMRFLWTTAVTENINPALSNYARLSFGKNVTNSPDAWAFLFQSPQLDGIPIKNFERWLTQRDISGGMTVATQRVTRVFDAGGGYMTPSLWYDDTARRTDFASNNNNIYFALDDRFTTSASVQIKVEMIDNSQTSWHLDYYNNSGALISTSNITNTNDGQKKTHTFTLNNPVFANQFSNMDFRLVNVGPGDLTVSWVRLVR